MKKILIFKLSSLFALILLVLFACKEEEYSLGTLSAPSNLVITTQVVGQNTANPYGDGSGLVNITATAENALSYRVAYTEVTDMASTPNFTDLPAGKTQLKFNKQGDITYRITVIAYGPGGTSTVATKDITVKSVYDVDPVIVTNLTGNASKTWKIDNTVSGHMGVGPWDPKNVTPSWWSAAPNEKSGNPCFYAATFTFTQVSKNSFSLKATTPDGAFTKTGSLAGIPGIPSSGDEGCYPYAGATSNFAFTAATSGVDATAPSTTTSILLEGNSTFIGYGATKKEYEILEITPTYMHLRVQGTETGNAWYLKLIPVQ